MTLDQPDPLPRSTASGEALMRQLRKRLYARRASRRKTAALVSELEKAVIRNEQAVEALAAAVEKLHRELLPALIAARKEKSDRA